MPKVPGLQLRKNTYHVRVRVPQDLRKILNKSEIIRSLKTQDYGEACRRIHLERAKIESSFQQWRHKDKPANDPDMLSGQSDHDLEGLALRWLSEIEQKLQNADAKDKKNYIEDSESYYAELQYEADAAHQEITGKRDDESHHGLEAAIGFLDRLGITYTERSEELHKLGKLFSMAIYERAQRELRYWEGKPFAPSHSMFQKSAQVNQNNQVSNNSRRITFKQLIKEYMSKVFIDWFNDTFHPYTFRKLISTPKCISKLHLAVDVVGIDIKDLILNYQEVGKSNRWHARESIALFSRMVINTRLPREILVAVLFRGR